MPGALQSPYQFLVVKCVCVRGCRWRGDIRLERGEGDEHKVCTISNDRGNPFTVYKHEGSLCD